MMVVDSAFVCFQDKTFGLKNKKGAKQQKYIKNVTQQVKYGQQSARQVTCISVLELIPLSEYLLFRLLACQLLHLLAWMFLNDKMWICHILHSHENVTYW